ncbi:MAG TPA: 50S ribosomal protein L10 [Alphaproteobacteria bacterium]|nr:50S ribosomal protein L10 [Alphaproteobacteria bacterium]
MTAAAKKIEAPHSANRAAKEKLVAVLGDELKDVGLVVVTQQVGLNADETRNLRVQLHKENVGLKVGKNTLVKHALKGTKLEALEKFLRGPTALAYSKDPVAAAKVTVEFAKKNDKFKVIGGAMGDQVLDAAQVKTLASLPSLDQLRGKIVGLLQAPATKIAGVLQAPAGQLARVLSARSKQSA